MAYRTALGGATGWPTTRSCRAPPAQTVDAPGPAPASLPPMACPYGLLMWRVHVPLTMCLTNAGVRG